MPVYSYCHSEVMYQLPQNILSKIYSYDPTYKMEMKNVFEELKFKSARRSYLQGKNLELFGEEQVDIHNGSISNYALKNLNIMYKNTYFVYNKQTFISFNLEFLPLEIYDEIIVEQLKKKIHYLHYETIEYYVGLTSEQFQIMCESNKWMLPDDYKSFIFTSIEKWLSNHDLDWMYLLNDLRYDLRFNLYYDFHYNGINEHSYIDEILLYGLVHVIDFDLFNFNGFKYAVLLKNN